MQLYHDALLISRRLRFVRDRRCNSIMMPCYFLDAWGLFTMQLYHDALLICQLLGFVHDRRCNSIMSPAASLMPRTMVYFMERFLSGVRHLTTTQFFPDYPWRYLCLREKGAWILQSSIHNEAPNSGRALTLGQRLIKGQTRWGTVTKVPGEFCFIDCYWEWLELVVGRNTRLLYSTRLYGTVTASLYTYDRNSDVVRAFCEAWCPSTNTLHTMAGELSISLWDLWSFGGLLVKGDFYEKRIPSFKELTSTSRDKTKVSSDDLPISFPGPTTRKQKKASHSKSTQNPDGSKIQAREWSSRESMLFAELGIKDDLKDETYLAAFLSCWLCLFVFPQKGSFLHPGVFRAASLMAADTIYSLAVPVLANIYHGLGGMSPVITLDNILYHWRICTRRNTLSELYLLTLSLEPCKHVTQRFTDWWTTKHGTYFEDNRHHLVSSAIPPPSQPRLPKN
ncbi:uncharacterized protein E6C27_scaffold468G001920 [Cucumis melo var. makuwa]|uniref:Aminotransferase-like plant mobile domain-containing protein n=1 Tax=Cucumis melo var. makuwa TaxID=1194695 RepID=A0A5A7V773_CUCMM|nr:uncharacterized protein E6C27_scaffold468G001920 [Cucumis melo var. makuwa]